MDKLTFLDNGEPAYKLGNCVYKNEISQRLYAYERTKLGIIYKLLAQLA